VRWDHAGPGVWPAIGFLDSRDQSVVPGYVALCRDALRAQAAERLRRANA